jgi:hypothetical protein
VDENLRHSNEDIQKAAGAALAALMRAYFPVRENGPSERLQSRVVDKYIKLVNTSDNPAETRGYALALGSLPKKLLSPSPQVLDSVLNCLCRAARFDATVGKHGDAETRRNANQALMYVTREVGFCDTTAPPAIGLSRNKLGQVFECFILALGDYNTDRRGDVGSWCRMAAMTGLEHLTFLAIGNRIEIETNVLTRTFGGLLKQLSEKLDNVRSHAGWCLERLLRSQSPFISELAFRDNLVASLQIGKDTNWSDAKVTFRRVVDAMNMAEFFHFVVSGVVVSVGALTESVTKEAEEALVEWIRLAEKNGKGTNERVEQLGQAFLDVLNENRRKGRVVLPLLKTMEKLFNRGLLDDLLSKRGLQFAPRLLGCLQVETKGCSDIYRLLSAVGVALGLLSQLNDNSVNRDVLKFMLEMLAHEFPRVRKHTADNLYVRLLEDPSVLPKQDNEGSILDMLLQGQWQSDLLGQHHIDQLSTKLAELMGFEFTPTWSRSEKQSPAPSKDDFASYASLINATLS